MFFKNQRIGKYQIVDTIGTGGFGSVYLARDIMIDKKVAVKVPHKQGEDVEKLLQEPRLLAALNHPNIVSVITAEKTNDVFYIVMEYVDGTSLEQYLRKHKHLRLDQAVEWFVKIAEALTYAHGKNILHRDIRPANILISHEGEVKVADLGTSRYLLDNPFASTRIGSPPYMAPEHFQGKATLQSDIYSMGVLMYESVTGRLPFFDKDPQRLARMARDGQYKLAHVRNPAIPKELSYIIARAMHRTLGTRYQAVRDLLSDLKRFQAHSMVHGSQDLAHLVDLDRGLEKGVELKRGVLPRDVSSREFSSLFCWNCSRPIQKRAKTCPNCNVSLK